MKKTGLEIVEMIAKGNAPKKIRTTTANHIEYTLRQQYYYYDDIELGLIECLNDEFEIVENNKVWKPELNEKYYIVSARGNVIESKRLESICSDYAIKSYWELGNCFKTKEEAQNKLEKIKIYTKLKRYALEHNTEKIDFKNNYQPKYYFYYDHYHDKIIVESCQKKTVIGQHLQHIGSVYFTSEEIAEQAIKEIGEDNIKKLFEEE